MEQTILKNIEHVIVDRGGKIGRCHSCGGKTHTVPCLVDKESLTVAFLCMRCDLDALSKVPDAELISVAGYNLALVDIDILLK